MPATSSRTRRTSRGSAIGWVITGTTADAASMSVRTSPGTAFAMARSADSRTVISPSGLSSRTTSPVSVTQEVVRIPANSISTRKAGIGRLPIRISSRSPTSRTAGIFARVAGSKIIHSCRAPGVRPPLASRRPMLIGSTGGSSSSRTSVRVPPDVVIPSVSCHRPESPTGGSTRPLTSTAPVPGSSENSNDWRTKSRSTRAVVRSLAAVCAPSSVISS